MENTSKPDDAPKKKALDLQQLVDQVVGPLGGFIKRHMVILFIGLSLFALIYAVFNVNLILQTQLAPSDDARSKYDVDFDKPTIDKINALGDRSKPPAINLPTGRINPFSE